MAAGKTPKSVKMENFMLREFDFLIEIFFVRSVLKKVDSSHLLLLQQLDKRE